MLNLSVVHAQFAVSRLDAFLPVPNWALEEGTFFSITRTKDELSIVCEETKVPAGVKSEKGWCALKVEGPLDFSLTGILSSLASPLAAASISIFAISTYDTDYLLIKKGDFEKALSVLGQFCKILR